MSGTSVIHTWGRALGCAALGLWLAGCAGPQASRLADSRPDDLPVKAEIRQVPFIAQETHQCGPAALAMILGHQGVAITADALTEQVYLPAKEGSLQVEMLAAARRQGLLAYTLAPQLQDVLREVRGGRPVLVLQNLGLSFAPRWHYAVVKGYDLDTATITLHSGVTADLVMPMSQFEHTWARSGHWAMLVTPPDEMPVTVQEANWVRAAVALERTQPEAARQAYEAALNTWPRNFTARMGLGNLAYARGDLAGAAEAFQLATRQHPDAGDAWNNLGTVLAKQGRKEEARAAIMSAINSGGPRVQRYWQTLGTLERDQKP